MLKQADAKFYENKVTAKNATAFPVNYVVSPPIPLK
jgi:hypothetical protein